MPVLFCYATPYSLISLSDSGKITRVKFPYPVFIDNYPDIWSYVYNETLSQLGLKSPQETVVVKGAADLIAQDIKGKSIKVIPAEKAFSEFNVPVMYLGERRFYSPYGFLDFNISSDRVFKWFDFDEASGNVENFFQNRLLYGPSSADSTWERAFQNALLREKMHFAFKNVPGTFLETVEEIYLSGEILYQYEDLQELLLSFLDSVNIPGFWHLYFDDKAVLGPVSGFYSEKKEKALEFLGDYKFKHLADVFIVPNVYSAQILFKDGKKQILNLKKEGIHLIPPIEGEEVTVSIKLKKENFEKELSGSEFGVIFDTRERPLLLSDSRSERFTMRDNLRKQVSGWEK